MEKEMRRYGRNSFFAGAKMFFVAALFAAFFAAICPDGYAPAEAAAIQKEETCPTGVSWYCSGNNPEYYISDSSLAEIIVKDGQKRVYFKRPGDVFVTVKFAGGDFINVLIHIVGEPVDETAVNRGTFAQEILDLVNIERKKAGAKPLRLSDDLIRAASIRAMEQVRKFSHTRPNGTPFYTVLVRGMNTTLGENVAVGQPSPKTVMRDWMNSAGHRKNILNPQYKELGVGYCYRKDSEYHHHWAQLFRR